MENGVIWEASREVPANLISWHDIDLPETGKFRVWVLSKAQKASASNQTSFSFTSLELQNMAGGFTKVSEEEKRARLALASLGDEKRSASFKSTLFRELPSAQIYADHLYCLRQALEVFSEQDSKSIKLVGNDRVFTKTFKKIAKSTYEKTITSGLKSTQADAVVIAKIYSDLSALGARQIVKQIGDEFNVDSSTVYAALRVARANGYLTSNGSGKSGGQITPLGLENFNEHGGEKRIKEMRKKAEGN